MKFEDVARGYASLWSKMQIRSEYKSAANLIAGRLDNSRGRYLAVAGKIGCPWWFIAIIHELEAGGDFTKHLHNGDPLTARTIHVPAGRPATGEPPFTWEQSADDALRMRGLDKVGAANWSIPRALFEWEAYNGLAYFSRGINSPYVWSFSNLYTSGKYVADHVYDAKAVSAQCGAGVILRAMIDLGYVAEPQQETATMDDLKSFINQFAPFAPLLATAIGGPAAGLAVKAIAEAVGADPTATPETVHDQLHTLPASKIGDAIKTAEKIMTTLQPATAPAVAPQAPAAAPAVPITVPVPKSPLDGLFPSLTGYKTIIGTVIGVAALAVYDFHLLPWFTQDMLSGVLALAGGVAGWGLLAKADRLISAVSGSQRQVQDTVA